MLTPKALDLTHLAQCRNHISCNEMHDLNNDGKNLTTMT
jgi:hypothetical protein